MTFATLYQQHRKPGGPPRRSPSRKHRRSWEGDDASSDSQPGPSRLAGKDNSVSHTKVEFERPKGNTKNAQLPYKE